MQKFLMFALFLCAQCVAWGQTEIGYRYWFDSDETTMQTGSTTEGPQSMQIDVSALSEGFHLLHFQANGETWSAPQTGMFVKIPQHSGFDYRYWFDANETEAVAAHSDSPTLKIPLDVSSMAEGFHSIYFQVFGKELVSTKVGMIIKLPQSNVDSVTCMLSVDSKLFKKEMVAISDNVVNWTIDATAIPQGLHKAMLLMVTRDGVVSSSKETFFYRDMTASEKQSLKCYYLVDGGDHYVEAPTIDGNLYQFELDMSSLSEGIHRLTYLLMVSSSGEEVYAVSGNGSQGFGGFTAKEEGKYYIALHDIVCPDSYATKSVTLDFVHQMNGKLMGINTADRVAEHVNVYNVSGQLVRPNVLRNKALKGLSHGIYIVGDKKYIVE